MRRRPGLVKRGPYFHIDKVICGKRVAKSLETTDEEQAARLYDQICADAWKQKHLDEKPRRYWEEAALLYVQRYEGRALDTYRLEWLNGKLTGTPLDRITLKFVRNLLKDRKSQRHYAAVISAVLREAEEEEYIPAKPRVMVGRPSRKRTRWLTEDEARQLLKQAGYLYDAILFSLATGLRQANVFGLRWNWIKDRMLIVPEGEFKQGREHAIPLNRTAMECVKRQIGKHTDLVFTDAGRPLDNPKAWESKWNIARRGIEDFRWHDLRHTWGTYLKLHGVPVGVIEDLGGWQSNRMVDRYAHASVESLRPYTEVLDPVLSRIIHAEPAVLEVVK